MCVEEPVGRYFVRDADHAAAHDSGRMRVMVGIAVSGAVLEWPLAR